MQMKINASLVKQKRIEKLWSQEELAIASGLGLRTVQRIESQGKTSFETLKSIASALNLTTEQLSTIEFKQAHYYNVQLGYTILTVLISALIICVWQFTKDLIQAQTFITISILLTIISSLFGTLSVKVTSKQLNWYFGIGFWNKKLEIASIKNVRTVKNKGWWGWGIRHYGDGWLYNVSGLRAIEITLVDGRRLRIGSDEPDQLSNFLNEHIAL